MNLRNVLRAYSLLRQLSDDESALLNILRALNDNDREQLVASMSDKPQKKAGKKSAGGGGGRSKRGESLKQQMGTALKPLADVINQPRCTAMVDDNGGEMQCEETIDHNVHHKQTDPNYHEFVAPSTTGKADAQSAAGGS